MLGGIEPVIIFQFGKLAPSLSDLVAKIPVISQIPTVIEQPPIPIYFNEEFTKVMIDSESKNIDIETDTQTLSNGTEPETSQKGLSTTVTINLLADKSSLALTLLSSLLDLCFDKSSSKEYAITYVHGPITVFRGLLSNYSVSQSADSTKMEVKIELTKGQKQPSKVPPLGAVPVIPGATPL